MRFRLRRSLPYEDRKEEAPSCQIVQQNYAIDAKIKDRLVAVESAESEAAQTYANLIVVKAGNEETENTYCIHWYNAGWSKNPAVISFLSVKHIHNPIIRFLTIQKKKLGLVLKIHK